MATKHVIIGGGPAGMHAIETIRKYQPDGSEIHLICNEPAYSRMVIPYWMAGQIDEGHVLTANDEFYSQHGVIPHIGRPVSSVDPGAGKLTIEGGETLNFDALLIATGASATRPPISGVELPGVHTLWTISDARAVNPRAEKGKDVLFLGAGFIGFIILNALYKKGCRLSVVEIEPQILPRMLDRSSAQLAADWLGQRAVQVHTGTSVSEITASGNRLSSRLATGQTVESDAVVVATGIRPNIDFLHGSGIELDEGILVDDHMRTNFPNVYAGGDCAQGPDLLGSSKAIHAVQPTAIDHGRIAGANMAGQDVSYEGSLLINVLDICGLQAASFGRWTSDGEALSVRNDSRPIYRKIIFDGDCIVGAILLGQTSDLSTLNDMGMIKGFIQTKTPLGSWKEYLRKHPLDIRRPYIACGVAAKLLDKTLLPEATEDLGYRYQNARPDSAVDRGPHHAVFADSWREVNS